MPVVGTVPNVSQRTGGCASSRRNVWTSEEPGSALPMNSRSMSKTQCHLS